MTPEENLYQQFKKQGYDHQEARQLALLASELKDLRIKDGETQ